mmetsp:Transcript_17806/g.49386  ORF Transcript_17806/g.49386 Transcript_17806/m.49386 type:complete len:217 (+) Transcript_17806:952-1602(+)
MLVEIVGDVSACPIARVEKEDEHLCRLPQLSVHHDLHNHYQNQLRFRGKLPNVNVGHVEVLVKLVLVDLEDDSDDHQGLATEEGHRAQPDEKGMHLLPQVFRGRCALPEVHDDAAECCHSYTIVDITGRLDVCLPQRVWVVDMNMIILIAVQLRIVRFVADKETPTAASIVRGLFVLRAPASASLLAGSSQRLVLRTSAPSAASASRLPGLPEGDA